MTSATSFEPLVDDVLECFVAQLNKRFAENCHVFDLGQWLQFCAFDLMGTMSFSKRYGFLEQGRDVEGMVGTINAFMRAGAPVSDLPADFFRSTDAIFNNPMIR